MLLINTTSHWRPDQDLPESIHVVKCLAYTPAWVYYQLQTINVSQEYNPDAEYDDHRWWH